MGTREEILSKVPPEQLVPQARDFGVIASLVSEGRTALGIVSRADFSMWAASNGMRAKIEDHANTSGDPLRSIALACRDVIQGAAAGIDFSLASNQMMLAIWVQSGELLQSQADELITLATQAAPITVADVAAALEGM